MFDQDFTIQDVFPPIPPEQWRRMVEEDLGAAAFERKLTRRTPEGLAVRPLYTAEDAAGAGAPPPGVAPYTRGAAQAVGADPEWDLRQDHQHPDPDANRAAIRDDLAHGVDSLILKLDPSGERGIVACGAEVLGRVLADVDLSAVPVAVEAGPHFTAAAAMLREVWSARGVAPEQARGSHLADPLSVLMAKGRLPDAPSALLAELGDLARRCDAETPGVTAAEVSTCPVHDAGAGAAQELGAALSTGVAYLKAMTDAGLGLDAAAAQLQVCFSTGGVFFQDVAKLRAARTLWARMIEAAGGDAEAQRLRLHVRTSVRMLTRRDPWVNILRATTGAFAAVVGGAEILTVAPYDHLLGPPDDLSRRIARNIPIILHEESHLGRVADPAGGSWFVESLTEELAEKGWAFFQALEGEGGVTAALESGWLQARVGEVRAERAVRAAKRKDAVTGVSEFPNLLEEPPVRETPDPTSLRERLGAPGVLAREGGAAVTVEALPSWRPAEAFENLRDRSDVHLADAGARPRVFAANLGPLAVTTGRSTWSRNFLAAGGVELIDEGGYETPAAAAGAFATSGAGAAILCSSDDLYAEHGLEAVRALKAAGAGTVILAGRPDDEAAWREAGLDLAIHLGCNVLEILEDLHRRLEVA